ncbi:MAG: hypothetical protein EA376_00060 [Phycisphaeraceae bacterium]|nr:MAG: hypothetical protein EA376_00060 [Phycisphaeraceae bacterium]
MAAMRLVASVTITLDSVVAMSSSSTPVRSAMAWAVATTVARTDSSASGAPSRARSIRRVDWAPLMKRRALHAPAPPRPDRRS